LAVSVLGHEFSADAEDVAQDVLVRIHRALTSFRGEAKFGTWVYRIAFNHALTVKARTRYRAPHVNDAVLLDTPALQRGPADLLEDAARRRTLLGCVDELPEVYQSALRLHYWLGTSVGDIAAMLDVPENTVKSYLYRGRQLLRALLAERGFDAR
jgi:RNA polymerase sigma-70 factor (ECF subfamily)